MSRTRRVISLTISAGSLKPLLACCVDGVDLAVRRHALSGERQRDTRCQFASGRLLGQSDGDRAGVAALVAGA